MLFWFRTHASRIATMAMASLMALGVSTVSPHVDDCHDSACLAGIVEHDASAHRFEAPEGAADIDHLHCLVCHWARSFRPPITVRFVASPDLFVRPIVQLEFVTVAGNEQVAQPPLRSPPSSRFRA